MKGFRMIFLIMVIFQMSQSFAKEQTQELVRQPRTMAMGGAGVGLADDEFALFNNPAGIAGNQQRGFRPVGVGIEGSWDTYTNFSEILSLKDNFSVSSLNVLMNKDIAFRLSQVPMIYLPNFTLAYLFDSQIVMNQYNVVNPNFNFGYMTTHGLQIGTGWSFKQGRRSSEEFRVGVSTKLLFRKGGFYDIGTAGMLQIASEGRAYLDRLVGPFGTGFGGDVGVQYLRKINSSSTFMLGSSLLDIGNTKFSESSAMPIPMNWSLGVGFKKMLFETTLSFGLDFRNVLMSTALSNKVHVGGEVDLGMLKLQAGLNQLNATYGLAFDFWVLKLMVLSYAEELGPSYHQLYSRRMMTQLNFNMPI